MPLYRFESVDGRGTPIHGILNAESESDLRALLQRRGQRLVSAQSQTVLGSDSDVADRLPRMVQLRVGESLRSAFLTQIPAQDALRAAAREPSMHPLTGLFPWLLGIGLFLLLLIGVHAWAVGAITVALATAVIVVLLIIPVAWMAAVYVTQTRPRWMLNRLADRLDAGETAVVALGGALAEPLRTIAMAKLPEESKARVLAELATRPSITGWGRHQFAMTLLGSFVMLFAAGMAAYGFLMVPVPAMKAIFEGFDLDLPVFTQFVIRLSDSFRAAKWIGFGTLCGLGVSGFVLLYGLLYRGWGADTIQSIPVLGTGLKWVNLARVSRLLAVLIRNDCPAAESLRIATEQKLPNATTDEGARLAERIDERRWIDGAGSALDGLPVSLLLSTDTTSGHQRRRAVAASTFDGLAAMFEQSVTGYGTIVSAMIQVASLLLLLGIVGLMMIATYLPLIRLLNDLM